jgi:hypothetical protein
MQPRKCRFVNHFKYLAVAYECSLQSYRISGLMHDANSRLSRMSSKACAIEGILSTIPDQFQDLQVSSQETKHVVTDLTDTISARMDYLPFGLRDMVECALRRVLEDFYRDFMKPANNEEVDKYSTTTSSYDHSVRDDQEILNSGHVVSERPLISRQSHQRVYQTWFGVLSVHTTTSNFMETITAWSLKPSTS